MAVCAIVSARLRDGAVLTYPLDPSCSSSADRPSSEDFYRASIEAFPVNLTHAKAFDYKRAKALLAILCIQYGDVAQHHTHLGEYLVLASNDGFHDETRWPGGLKEPDLQERRRLVRWGFRQILTNL